MDIYIKRKKIDEIDNNIIKYLDERFNLTQEIGLIKKEKNMDILNKKREEEIMQKIKTLTVSNYKEVKDVYTYILYASKKKQSDE